MSGRILIIDPVITNRILLKAQLRAEYFTVDMAGDLVSAPTNIRKCPPDVILLNFETEESTGFATCKKINQDPLLGSIPVVLLCQTVKEPFWQAAYMLGVDEILPFVPDIKLLSFRISQIIRRKELLLEQKKRSNTLMNMGFAEDGLAFPPRFSNPLLVDCTHAPGILSGLGGDGLGQLLQRDFPRVQLVKQPDAPAVVQIIDETELGRTNALFLVNEMKRARIQGETVPKLLYITKGNDIESHRRTLEAGADDFLPAPYCDAELASRIRALAWLHQIKSQTDNAVNAKLQLALRDEMTGLYNRRYALQHLENLKKKTRKQSGSITVMMLDLDNFKAINDTYGHTAGDAVICETARRLNRNLREADLVARIGGEEFLIILTNTPISQASQIADRMRHRINSHLYQAKSDGPCFPVSISIGVAHFATGSTPSRDLLDLADRALYQSKDSGRNRVTIFPNAA